MASLLDEFAANVAAHPAVQLHLRIRDAVQAILQREGYDQPTAYSVAQHAVVEAETLLWKIQSDRKCEPVGCEDDPFA